MTETKALREQIQQLRSDLVALASRLPEDPSKIILQANLRLMNVGPHSPLWPIRNDEENRS